MATRLYGPEKPEAMVTHFRKKVPKASKGRVPSLPSQRRPNTKGFGVEIPAKPERKQKTTLRFHEQNIEV